MERVLHPTDGSAAAFQATLYLIEFAERYGAPEIHVANVQPRRGVWAVREREDGGVDDAAAIEHHLQTRATLHALNEAGLAHTLHLRRGPIAESLVALGDELGCSHIVIGPRGAGGVGHLLLGSVTHQVLRLAQIPVVCVKHPPRS
jgi:nucleotide-binding universal stress UspA family protein